MATRVHAIQSGIRNCHVREHRADGQRGDPAASVKQYLRVQTEGGKPRKAGKKGRSS